MKNIDHKSIREDIVKWSSLIGIFTVIYLIWWLLELFINYKIMEMIVNVALTYCIYNLLIKNR